MALITQKKFVKQKEVEQTISINKVLLEKIDEYIQVAGIEHGIVRAGEAKSTQEAKREFFIMECIKQIIERDAEEIKKLKNEYQETKEDDHTEPVAHSFIQTVLGDEMSEIANALEA